MTAMGDVLPYRPMKAKEEATSLVGMVVFLGSWAMMFATLFFAYGYVRARALEWPPDDLPRLPLFLPGVNTAVIFFSSLAMQYGLTSVRRGQIARLFPSVMLAVALGSLFLVLQTVLWLGLYQDGLRPSSGGNYGAVFYGFTWFHAIHALVGLAGLGSIARRALQGAFGPAKFLPVRLWTLYWHFVGIIWALMFASMFVF